MLRRATVADAKALCDARKKQLVDEGLSTAANIDAELLTYFEKTLADGTLVEWVAEEDGEIVATAGLVYMPFPPTYVNPVGTRGYVTNMYTAPNYRRRGIASCLLDKLLDDARDKGIKKLLLCASDMGRSVYFRCGFSEHSGWMELDL